MKSTALRVTGSVASLASCLVMFGGAASAQSISDTGHGSTNIIKVLNSCSSKVTNDTDFSIDNSNSQSSSSGTVEVTDNDDVNNVSTGNSSNSNDTSFDLSVTNSGGNACAPESSTPTPPAGGQGGETPTPVVATTTTVTPVSGGQGGEVAAAPEVAAVPVGGVGAGTGGQTYLAGLATVTLASTAAAAARLFRPLKSLSGRYL